MSFISQLEEAQQVLSTMAAQASAVDVITDLIVRQLKQGHTLFSCGNGGSATDAAHLSEELVGRYRANTPRPALPAVCLNADSAALTCIANDFGYEQVFARQIGALGRSGDLLVCFSTSGRSPNITAALKEARKLSLITIGFLGGTGGDAKDLCDYSIIVPSSNGARVQEVHTLLLHAICEALEAAYT